MKYIVAVFAVEEKDFESFDEALDTFIEGSDLVHGAHVSAPHDTRESAINGPWKDKPFYTE
jgi:hypothetical protein